MIESFSGAPLPFRLISIPGPALSLSESPAAGGVVQLVSSPIGNLGDITMRAVEVLARADVIACEDTRHSIRLLRHLELEAKELVALHDHNDRTRSTWLVERARNGERIAYLSDAGTPGVSDPGYRLVRACVDAGVKVEVIPGASAVITALVGSGLPTDAFFFGGFLPVKSGRKTQALEEALDRKETSLFFESPHRLTKTLESLSGLDPERPLCVARELTKKFETYHRGTAAELLQEFSQRPPKGEITLVIQGKGWRSDKAKDKGDRYRPKNGENTGA